MICEAGLSLSKELFPSLFLLFLQLNQQENELSYSKLTLHKYKRNSKKIIGTTVKNATVKVKVAKRTYTVKSDNAGKFTVKLKKKLKSKNKIKVSVSQEGYKTWTKTYVVR